MKENFKKYLYLIVVIVILVICFFVYLKGDNTSNEISFNEDEQVINNEKDFVEEKTINYFVDIKGEVVNPGVYEVSVDSRIIDVITKAGGLTKNADTSVLNLSKKVSDEMNIKIYSKSEVKKAKESIVKEPEVIEIIKEIEKECVCPEVNEICINNENKDKVETDTKNDESLEDKNETKEENKNENKEENKNESNEENKEQNKQENNDKNENIKNGLININTATMEELMSLPNIGEAKANKIIEYREQNVFKNIEDIKNVSGIGEALFEKIKEYITV